MKKKLTKTKFKSAVGAAGHLFSRIVCLGAVSLICSSALAQNLFVADSGGSGNIYEFTPAGVRSIFASGLSYPSGLIFDSAGNLFAAVNGTIYKFTPAGVRTTFAVGFNLPKLAFDRGGNLFVSDLGTGAIFKFGPNGTKSTFASGLNTTTGLACDSAGNLFVSEYGSGVKGGTLNGVPVIYKFTPDGARTTFASSSELNAPLALAFDSAGDLFVSDDTVTDSTELQTFPGGIYRFSPGGARSTFAPGFTPFALAFDSAGNLFVSTDAIYKFTPGGVRSTFATGLGGPLAFGKPSARPPTDFNNDGKPDYLLYNSSTRQTAIWYLNNNVYTSWAYGRTLPAGWNVVGVADFNRDGKPDYLLYNPSTQQTAIWYLNNNVYTSGAYGPTFPAGWSVVAP